MLSGKEKAQLLLSLLGEKAKNVLSRMSPESAALLTESIGDTPSVTSQARYEFLEDILKKAKEQKIEADQAQEPEVDMPAEEMSLFAAEHDTTEPVEEETGVVSTPEPVQDDRRTPQEVAAVLTKQKPQMIAFILSKVEEDLREKILSCLPQSLQDEVQTIKAENLPLSEAVFHKIYDSVFKRSPLDETSPQEEEKKEENQSGFSSMEMGDQNFSWDQPLF